MRTSVQRAAGPNQPAVGEIREGLLWEVTPEVTSGKNARIGEEEGSEQGSHTCHSAEAGAVLETSYGLSWLVRRMQVRERQASGNG